MQDQDPSNIAASSIAERSDLTDPIILADRQGNALLLSVDEGELYQSAADAHGLDAGDYPAKLARLTVNALEALGRLRIRNIERAVASDLGGLADAVRAELAGAVADLAASTSSMDREGNSTAVLNLAHAYRELRNLAGAEELAARGTGELERRALRVEGAAGHLCDAAAEFDRDTFEGRLEPLIRPLELLAQAIDHPSARRQA